MAQSLAGSQPSVDAKQVRKFAALGVLSVVAVGVIFMQMRPSAEDRAIQENFKKSQEQAALAPATQAGGTAQVVAPTVQSQFVRADVNIEDLLAGVQSVNFYYDDVRIQRNPMQPLVGAGAPVTFRSANGENDDEMLSERITQAIRNMKITGIIWDEIYPVAVVNNEIVHNGYVFQDTGIRVASIESTRIILQFDETEFPVELEEL